MNVIIVILYIQSLFVKSFLVPFSTFLCSHTLNPEFLWVVGSSLLLSIFLTSVSQTFSTCGSVKLVWRFKGTHESLKVMFELSFSWQSSSSSSSISFELEKCIYLEAIQKWLYSKNEILRPPTLTVTKCSYKFFFVWNYQNPVLSKNLT